MMDGLDWLILGLAPLLGAPLAALIGLVMHRRREKRAEIETQEPYKTIQPSQQSLTWSAAYQHAVAERNSTPATQAILSSQARAAFDAAASRALQNSAFSLAPGQVIKTPNPGAFAVSNGGAGVARTTLAVPNPICRGTHNYSLARAHNSWIVEYGGRSHTWHRRPTRAQIAAKVREFRAGRPTRRHPDTLGWRYWWWDGKHLVSPHQHTLWTSHQMSAHQWIEDDVVDGFAGIHAKRSPDNWLLCPKTAVVLATGAIRIHGLVERFGRYVLGSEGWRAERVIIRELMAPDPETMLALMRTYPEVKVHLSPYYVAEEV